MLFCYNFLGQMGYNQLGRDRAFRIYWVVDSLSLLLVEDQFAENGNIPSCETPTPLDKVCGYF